MDGLHKGVPLKTTVHCIGLLPDYERQALQSADPALYDVHIYNPRTDARKFPLYKLLSRSLKNRVIKGKTLDYIEQHKALPNTLFLIHEFEVNTRVLDDLDPAINAAIYIRNPVSKNPEFRKALDAVKDKNFKILSFDPDDCARYGFTRYNQFVGSMDGFGQITAEVDFTFVGRDKGRATFLQALQHNLETRGFSVHMQIRGKSSLLTRRENVSYRAYLQTSLKGRCIIDIVQDSQSGLTLRPMEAAACRRKLLTNNRAILEEAFYHPDNIFVLDETGDLDGIEDFMRKPYVEIDRSILREYSADALYRKCLEP